MKKLVRESLNESEENTTLYDLMIELQTWIKFNPEILKQAKLSKINKENNSEFANLLNDWIDGRYDEDPYYLANELENLLR